MPQVWLTDYELGEFLAMDRDEIRDIILKCGMPRRHCSDGQTRVKLMPDLAVDYMIGFASRFASNPATGEPNTIQAGPQDRQFDVETVSALLDAAQTAGIDVTGVFASLLRDVAQKARAAMPSEQTPAAYRYTVVV
jgi:hypothetical protein